MSAPEDSWQNRAAGLRCQTCKWWVWLPKAGGLGRCRRHAPTLDGWPAVYDADWCGDHELDEAAADELAGRDPEEIVTDEEVISAALDMLRNHDEAPEADREAGPTPVTERIVQAAERDEEGAR